MKRVSFKVAKTIKEAGYPQEKLTDKVYLVNCDKEGKLAHYQSALYYDCVITLTYLEVWLWLWREKKINIDISKVWDIEVRSWIGEGQEARMFSRYDPEEAIIAAIEYLVDNNLIK